MDGPSFVFDASCSSAVVADAAPAQASEASLSGPLDADLLSRMHRYWMAANYLTVGQIFLQDNPLLREPLRPAAHQAAAARALGNVAGVEPALRPSQSPDRRARRRRASTSRDRDTADRRSSRTCTSRARTRRSIRRSRATSTGCDSSSDNSRRPAASRVTSVCRRPARSTKAVSWATCSRTRSARRSTIRISSSPPSSATAKRRPRRSRARGRARAF